MFHVGHSNSSLVLNQFTHCRRILYMYKDVGVFDVPFALYFAHFIGR